MIVRSPEEIASTLDSDGTLDSLPFMPEMLRYCGRRFRVSRRIEKTCVEGYWSQRRFPENDVVVLEDLRCDGAAHDGCKRGCMLFWKEAWLRPAADLDAAPAADLDAAPADDLDGAPADDSEARRTLAAGLRVKRDDERYFCQSTQLGEATVAFPPGWKFGLIPRMVWVALREIWVGNRSPGEVMGLMWHWAKLSYQRRRIGDRVKWMPGPNRRTPTRSLGLRPGDKVRIKPAEEIRETLDGRSRNRGLRIAVAMTQNCGREFVVRERIDRMISEETGEMRTIENTVSLEGLECLCAYHFGGCPRGDLQFWREIWLERLGHDGGPPPPEGGRRSPETRQPRWRKRRRSGVREGR